MIWSRVSSTPVGVTAWVTQLPGAEPAVRLTVGVSTVELSIDDAASLGGYLLSQKADEE